jgi:hypothetical protein
MAFLSLLELPFRVIDVAAAISARRPRASTTARRGCRRRSAGSS